jgi:outer membrane biosynthesis protein TonB
MQTGTATKLVTWAMVLGAVPLLTACASAQARAPDKPALNVPPPPPHVIELPAEPVEPVGEIPATPAAAPRSTRSTSPKPEPTRPPEKPETKPDQPVETPPVPVAPPPPASNAQLRTPQTADAEAAAKAVRTTIDKAKNALATVNFGPLSNERKKAYNDAKLFMQQAEDALKEGNIVYAQAVAAKAETLARELAGR